MSCFPIYHSMVHIYQCRVLIYLSRVHTYASVYGISTCIGSTSSAIGSTSTCICIMVHIYLSMGCYLHDYGPHGKITDTRLIYIYTVYIIYPSADIHIYPYTAYISQFPYVHVSRPYICKSRIHVYLSMTISTCITLIYKHQGLHIYPYCVNIYIYSIHMYSSMLHV